MRRFAVFAVLLLTGLNAQAQNARPNTRHGFWFGVGLGGGTMGVDCSRCPDDRLSGGAAYVRLGGTISPGFLLGVESAAWFTETDNGVKHTLGAGSIVGYWYPSRGGALYLKFGVGGMTYTADDGSDELEAKAGSASLGAGYEIRVGRNLSAVPFLNLFGSGNTDFKLNGQTVATNADLQIDLVQVGLGLTWH